METTWIIGLIWGLGVQGSWVRLEKKMETTIIETTIRIYSVIPSQPKVGRPRSPIRCTACNGQGLKLFFFFKVAMVHEGVWQTAASKLYLANA